MPIENHSDLITIDLDSILWRYMNLDKFFSLLKTESLFFCRADIFSDPFEGTYPKKEIEFRPLTYQQICNFFNIPFVKNKFEENERKRIDFNKRNRSATIINCWHINNYESDAMWRIYLKTNEGVAIQSTPKRIYSSLDETNEIIYPSKVRYIDYETDIWFDKTEYPIEVENSMTPFIHKRKEFSTETEFRLFNIVMDVLFYEGENYWNGKENCKGKFIKVNVKELIDKVVFPPTLNNQRQNEIIDLVIGLGYNFTFTQSILSNEPLL